jgi:hypothetical protein
MPGGDRTGPAGMGPMTGRSAGYCAGYPEPGYAGFAFKRGFGFGRGRGGGRGWRNWFHARGFMGRRQAAYGYPDYGADMPYGMPYDFPSAPPMRELDALKDREEYLGNALADIQKRIAELEKAGTP